MLKDKEQSGWVRMEMSPQPGCGWKIEKSIRFGAVSMGLTLGHRREQGKKKKKYKKCNTLSVCQAVSELFIQEEQLRFW